MNIQKDRKAKLESAYSFMLKYSKITVWVQFNDFFLWNKKGTKPKMSCSFCPFFFFFETLTDYAYLFIYCSCLLPAADTESKAYRHEFGFSTVQYGILFFIFFSLTTYSKEALIYKFSSF